MAAELRSFAEQKAQAATKFQPFAVNLEEIKRTVDTILSLFGRQSIFDEYTLHNITHVDDMLATAQWIIPEATKIDMTPADWLLLVLSIYFHDLGLVVTKDEFNNREKSAVASFRDSKLFTSPDYRAKISALPEEQREKFIYQEFVRANHGKRVRLWIEGKQTSELGFAQIQLKEIDRLLAPLDKTFRRDLAIVCESHNLDDLDDTSKYKISFPYGNSDEETANIQYSALLLRTIDLIQITNRRAPSTLFRLINPSDPISQIEWIKQNAVTRVRAKTAFDRDNVASDQIQSDTVEVYASFSNANGFFGLTSYLSYAKSQLEASYKVAQKTSRQTTRKYLFPWRHLDDSNVQAESFLKDTFGFEIDQAKILDLLTGHTLYNDSSIVVRELVQNSIDAVRLFYLNSPDKLRSIGNVRVVWDTDSSTLTVTDNGTGMTQEIIENHLLKVGSSRYQDPRFKESHPNFHPISRFGIGVLSAFMVADEVEIVTVSPEEENARQISLRSVHGKYLIKLLDKQMDPKVKAIGEHGTQFKLKFRPTAKKLDVLETLQAWIKFPECRVELRTNEQDSIRIGYENPRAAIAEYLAASKAHRNFRAAKYDVRQIETDGYSIAFALGYDAHYREWSIVTVPEQIRSRESEQPIPPISTCVEGIAVEFDIPGYRGSHILAAVNVTGRFAPKTNVARSALEMTNERELLLVKTYAELLGAVERECRRLVEEEGYSLTWSIGQLPYLLSPIISNSRGQLTKLSLFNEQLAKLPMFIAEVGDKRVSLSLHELESHKKFTTIESHLAESLEKFIREAKTEVTSKHLLKLSFGKDLSLPTTTIVTNSHDSSLFQQALNSKFQVVGMIGNTQDRRLDIEWEVGSGGWLTRERLRFELTRARSNAAVILTERARELADRRFGGRNNVAAPTISYSTAGLDDYFAVTAYATHYLLPDTKFSSLFSRVELADMDLDERISYLLSFDVIASSFQLTDSSVESFFRQLDHNNDAPVLRAKQMLLEAVNMTRERLQIYNPLSWKQRSHDTTF